MSYVGDPQTESCPRRNDQESREACARTKAAAALFAVICLLSQILGPNLTPNFGFPVKRLAIMS